jgi:late competence protein required for DNA uptake (superfamily II DNA/RNA helicase)
VSTPTREEWFQGLQPYYEAPTSKIGLRNWRLSQTDETERECRNCEETFDIEEFWTGTILSYYCPRCKPKRKKRRQAAERQIAADNRKKRKDEKKQQGGGLIKGLAGKAAGKMVEKAISS